MKFKGTIIGEASGSLASNTFSHNRGGQYIRQRAVPTNPQTSFQQVVRNAVASLTAQWGALTAAQRTAWDTYALNVPLVDTLGEARNAGGIGQYIRSNTPRLQDGRARIDTAPAIFQLGVLSPVGITSITAATSVMVITFTAADLWNATTGGFLFVYTSRAFSPSINYFNGPYRLAGRVIGNTGTPPASPQNITIAFTCVAGQRVGVRFRSSMADGRLSAAQRLTATAV